MADPSEYPWLGKIEHNNERSLSPAADQLSNMDLASNDFQMPGGDSTHLADYQQKSRG